MRTNPDKIAAIFLENHFSHMKNIFSESLIENATKIRFCQTSVQSESPVQKCRNESKNWWSYSKNPAHTKNRGIYLPNPTAGL